MEDWIDFDDLDFDKVLAHEMEEDPIMASLAKFDAPHHSASGASSSAVSVETPYVWSAEASHPSSSLGVSGDFEIEAPVVTRVSGTS